MAIDRNYTDTVEKMLRLAENAGTEEEAAAFSARAMELMAKFGIDQAMIDAAKVKNGEVSEDIVRYRFTIVNPYSDAKARMVAWVATAMGCKAVLHPDYSGRSTGGVTIVGFESTVERAKLLITSLLVQLSGLVRHQEDFWGGTPARTWRKNWAAGFAMSVYTRVKEHEASAKKDYEKATGTSTELVLRDRSALVEQKFDEMFKNLGKARQMNVGSGYSAGLVDGRKADIDFGNRVKA